MLRIWNMGLRIWKTINVILWKSMKIQIIHLRVRLAELLNHLALHPSPARCLFTQTLLSWKPVSCEPTTIQHHCHKTMIMVLEIVYVCCQGILGRAWLNLNHTEERGKKMWNETNLWALNSSTKNNNIIIWWIWKKSLGLNALPSANTEDGTICETK